MSNSVKAAGLETTLNKTGPFTVFAPAEIAFQKLHKDELDGWLKPENRIRLIAIVSSHVVEGKTKFKDLTDGRLLKPLNDKALIVKVCGHNVTVNGSGVPARDGEASSGMVHLPDTDVMPVINTAKTI